MSSTDTRSGGTSFRLGAMGELKSEAKAGLEDVGREARNAAGDYTARAAEQLDAISQGILAGAARIAEREGWGGQSLRSAADRISNFAQAVRTKSAGDLVADARDMAGSNPGVFYAACAAAGFALGRFMTASSESRGDGDYVASGMGYDETSGASEFGRPAEGDEFGRSAQESYGARDV